MAAVAPLERTVVVELDDQKPTLRTEGILLLGVVAMIVGTFVILDLADVTGSGPLRYGAIAWCGLVLAGGRGAMTSPRLTRTVRYRLTMRATELDIERRTADAPPIATRVLRGSARLRHVVERQGGPVRFCEVRGESGRLLFRARDRAVPDELSGESRTLGEWLDAWFAGAPAE